MAGAQPPFALFILDCDIDVEFLTDALNRSYNGNFEAYWAMYVVTEDYDDAPKKAGNDLLEGTKPPIDGAFKSPFIGKSLEYCAKWLLDAPADIALNREFFLAMNEFSRSEDTTLICRIIQPEGREMEVEYYPEATGDTSIQMAITIGTNYDEALSRYQKLRHKDKRPDRSRGIPYNFPSDDA